MNANDKQTKYAAKIAEMAPEALVSEAQRAIYDSSMASAFRQTGVDSHWQVDMLYAECVRRERVDLYDTAWKRASR